MSLTIVAPDTPVADANAKTIEIGFLNNLSDAALEQGERQIEERLAAASGETRVRLRLFSLSTIPRSTWCRARMDGRYADETALVKLHLDGLFVSGAEPQTGRLTDEAFWPQLAAIVDWARTGTRSTIWSCLAAHAAVLHLDGIERHRLPKKRTGFFSVERAADHPLLGGLAGASCVAQSRWNDLSEYDLIDAGYKILARSGLHADTFAKEVGSLFVFLQGHPEYDTQAIGREYRRDLLRFLSRETETYPTIPARYFAAMDEAELYAFEAKALRATGSAARFHLPPPRPELAEASHRFADVFFGNWLRLLHTAALEHAA